MIALICSVFVDFLMILSLSSTNWLTANKYRQGLWQFCIELDSPRPLPFGINQPDGCHWGRDAGQSIFKLSFIRILFFKFYFPNLFQRTLNLLVFFQSGVSFCQFYQQS